MTNQMAASERIIGTLRFEGDKGDVHLEDLYDTGIDDLWSALTDPERLGRWLGRVEGDLRPGGAFHAFFTSGVDGAGRVDVCEPPRRLQVTMCPGEKQETIVEAHLVAVGNQTRLVIEERGLTLEDVPDHGAGWQAHLEDLTACLSQRDRADWHGRWRALTPLYRSLAPKTSK